MSFLLDEELENEKNTNTPSDNEENHDEGEDISANESTTNGIKIPTLDDEDSSDDVVGLFAGSYMSYETAIRNNSFTRSFDFSNTTDETQDDRNVLSHSLPARFGSGGNEN